MLLVRFAMRRLLELLSYPPVQPRGRSPCASSCAVLCNCETRSPPRIRLLSECCRQNRSTEHERAEAGHSCGSTEREPHGEDTDRDEEQFAGAGALGQRITHALKPGPRASCMTEFANKSSPSQGRRSRPVTNECSTSSIGSGMVLFQRPARWWTARAQVEGGDRLLAALVEVAP
jgi:hypothetical protein